MFKKVRVGIIGLGTVGSALVKLLKEKQKFIRQNFWLDIEIAKVCDKNPSCRKTAAIYKAPFSQRWKDVVEDSHTDIVVELVGGLGVAYDIIKKAIGVKKAIVTANKALLAEKGKKIFSSIRAKKVPFGMEASVCGGIPIIKSISEEIILAGIRNIYGVLNGTTNYILSTMTKESKDFSPALKQAQKEGLAEANPALDIKGEDSRHKIALLSFLSFGFLPPLKDIKCVGIENIEKLDIQYARELGFTIKLLAVAKKEGRQVELRVQPALIPQEHPLAKTYGAYNAVFINTQKAGNFLFYGLGAGGEATASAVLSDILNISLGRPLPLPPPQKIHLIKPKEVLSRYYIRFQAKDQPGVLAEISKILASFKISIASVTQKQQAKSTFVPIVMLTHKAVEGNVAEALRKIDRLSFIKPPTHLIKIEDI